LLGFFWFFRSGYMAIPPFLLLLFLHSRQRFFKLHSVHPKILSSRYFLITIGISISLLRLMRPVPQALILCVSDATALPILSASNRRNLNCLKWRITPLLLPSASFPFFLRIGSIPAFFIRIKFPPFNPQSGHVPASGFLVCPSTLLFFSHSYRRSN